MQDLQAGQFESGLGLRPLVAGGCVAGGALGVDRIGLRAARRAGADRATELDNPITELVEVSS
ncbi:hypothetical protein [Pseudonocardia sp. MH-G8]|uniref:hypothetical protein n=1 Tax=Pseudonocardia sp. MH-G8 TaxID=1854588 RepID=UPI000BA108C6|nr:hypothetical protein [Pseudonocardia sp. MH-G8]OZM75661.1 hypothetical protein CFP66_45115 [Pseudonocardia sp. MH-G8]